MSLEDRVQQDVWHDNFVPKYSAISSAKPSTLVLVGVLLIFGSFALTASVQLLAVFFGKATPIGRLATFVGAGFFLVISIRIMTTQFLKWRRARNGSPADPDELE